MIRYIIYGMIRYIIYGMIAFWLTVVLLDITNIPLYSYKNYCQRNTEECLQWVLDTKDE